MIQAMETTEGTYDTQGIRDKIRKINWLDS